jgi:hypothetical protein
MEDQVDPFLMPSDTEGDPFVMDSDSSTSASPVKPAVKPQAILTEIVLPSNDTILSPLECNPSKPLLNTADVVEIPIEVEVPPASFEESLFRYLDSSLRGATQQFLTEFQLEVAQCHSIDSDIDRFLSELSTEIRSIVHDAVHTPNDVTHKITTESIRANFADVLRFPVQPEPSKFLPPRDSAALINDATRAFVTSSQDSLAWLTEARESLAGNRAMSDPSLRKRHQALMAFAVDFDGCGRVIDDLSSFFEARLSDIQARRNAFRERQLRLLDEQSDAIICPDASAWAELLDAIRAIMDRDEVSPLQELQHKAEAFRDEIYVAKDALEFRINEITRIAKLDPRAAPLLSRWPLATGPDVMSRSGIDM